jgi:hypothetical protein
MSTVWVNLNHRFDDRWAVLTIGVRDFRRYCGIICNGMEPDNIHTLQQRAIACVEHYRPELKGCVVFAIGYSSGGLMVQISVSHGSLPPGGTEIPLIPERTFHSERSASYIFSMEVSKRYAERIERTILGADLKPSETPVEQVTFKVVDEAVVHYIRSNGGLLCDNLVQIHTITRRRSPARPARTS